MGPWTNKAVGGRKVVQLRPAAELNRIEQTRTAGVLPIPHFSSGQETEGSRDPVGSDRIVSVFHREGLYYTGSALCVAGLIVVGFFFFLSFFFLSFILSFFFFSLLVSIVLFFGQVKSSQGVDL